MAARLAVVGAVLVYMVRALVVLEEVTLLQHLLAGAAPVAAMGAATETATEGYMAAGPHLIPTVMVQAVQFVSFGEQAEPSLQQILVMYKLLYVSS
jgi:hypothetical protein